MKETSKGAISLRAQTYVIICTIIMNRSYSLVPFCSKFISNKRVLRKVGVRIFEVLLYLKKRINFSCIIFIFILLRTCTIQVKPNGISLSYQLDQSISVYFSVLLIF